ncbi:MAG TPA: hypothetical protein DIT86_00370 [Hyphomonas sp.]|nr:hypothetical protein [Hyphomonas sp.]
MKLFDPSLRSHSAAAASLHRVYEIFHLLVDFLAAAMFVIGSALFFFQSTTFAATWLFLIGSFFFAVKPTLRLIREVHLLQIWRRNNAAAD